MQNLELQLIQEEPGGRPGTREDIPANVLADLVDRVSVYGDGSILRPGPRRFAGTANRTDLGIPHRRPAGRWKGPEELATKEEARMSKHPPIVRGIQEYSGASSRRRAWPDAMRRRSIVRRRCNASRRPCRSTPIS